MYTVLNIRDARYIDASHTQVRLDVNTEEFGWQEAGIDLTFNHVMPHMKEIAKILSQPENDIADFVNEDVGLELDEVMTKRALNYPGIQEQVIMLGADFKNGTTTWQDAIDAVDAAIPLPTVEPTDEELV